MRRVPRTAHLPALGFAVTLAAALVVSLAGGDGEDARLRASVRGYLEALARGDAAAAAAWRLDGRAGPERARAAAFRGAYWALRDHALEAGGRQAVVRVVWMDRRGGEGEEVQVWRRRGPDAWRFVALQG